MKDKYPDIVHIERLEQGPLHEEALTMQLLIESYCKKTHGTHELCPQCDQFLQYCLKRLACCPFQENKPTCRNCKIHCYAQQQKEQIKVIMRTCGPALTFTHPILAIKHLLKGFKAAPERPRNRKAQPQKTKIKENL